MLLRQGSGEGGTDEKEGTDELFTPLHLTYPQCIQLIMIDPS